MCDATKSVQKETIPKGSAIKFQDYDKCVTVPYVMYADIEAVLSELPPTQLNTIKTHEHLPVAIENMMIMRKPNEYHEKYVEHIGKIVL